MSGLALAVHVAAVAVYALAVAWAVATDFKRLIIANSACVAVAVAFLPAAVVAGLDAPTIAWHYGVGATLMAVGALAFARKLAGGGDVKLLAAVAVWMGPGNILPYLVLMSLVGGALAVLVLIAARMKRRVPALGRVAWLGDGAIAGQEIPYGVAVGLVALAMLPRLDVVPPSWFSALVG